MPSLPTLPIPRISVALCVHNAGRFLAPQLASKLATLAAAIGYSDLAYCDSEYIDEDGKVLGGRVSDDLKAMHHGRAVLPYVFQNTASGHAMLVRRELFEL